jgi:hypothetical protein
MGYPLLISKPLSDGMFFLLAHGKKIYEWMSTENDATSSEEALCAQMGVKIKMKLTYNKKEEKKWAMRDIVRHCVTDIIARFVRLSLHPSK